MSYVLIGSLQRGSIFPPEPVDAITDRILSSEYRRAAVERDPDLSIEQWWMEEGRRAGYVKRKPVRREDVPRETVKRKYLGERA